MLLRRFLHEQGSATHVVVDTLPFADLRRPHDRQPLQAAHLKLTTDYMTALTDESNLALLRQVDTEQSRSIALVRYVWFQLRQSGDGL